MLGSAQLFQRWLRHPFSVKKNPKHPETANVPEDGATLYMCKMHLNCAIYLILNLKSFFREMIFGHQNFDEKGFGRSKLSFEGKTNMYNRLRNHLGQCHPVALEKSCKQCPKRE